MRPDLADLRSKGLWDKKFKCKKVMKKLQVVQVMSQWLVVALTNTFLCEFLEEVTGELGLPVPGVDLQDLLAGLQTTARCCLDWLLNTFIDKPFMRQANMLTFTFIRNDKQQDLEIYLTTIKKWYGTDLGLFNGCIESTYGCYQTEEIPCQSGHVMRNRHN